MTKQEHKEKTEKICNTKHPQDWDFMLSKLKSEYIKSLEAENAKLEKALEKAIEILADEGAILCPAIKMRYICNDGKGCDKPDSCETDICWREYLMNEGEGEDENNSN